MHDRRFNPEHMAKLESPERKAAVPPELLLDKLALSNSSTVLDLGAGTGYFAIPAAARTNGTVYALDIEPQMLEVIRKRADERQLPNVRTIKGEFEQIPLENESVDRVIASLVLHEAEPLHQVLTEINRVLHEGGLCLCVEWEKKVTDQGPPLHHRIDSEEMKRLFEELGFAILEIDHRANAQYVLIVQKR
ncbi:class I SAM-dependent methyltransferase [Paenibacillus macerans]|uniref:class I SAM-dependent methyltransferase n=1 Tax=Paenibacillus macerans TaxID=44252 RepID=UPI003D3212B6